MSHHDLTARIAYSIFEQRGYTHGRHQQDWFAAEEILRFCQDLMAGTASPAKRPKRPRSELASLSLEQQALEALTGAVEEQGRASVAGRLGYRSSSPVGKFLRGDRPLSRDLAERILEAFGDTELKVLRRAA